VSDQDVDVLNPKGDMSAVLSKDQAALAGMQELAQKLQAAALLDEKMLENIERLKEEGRGY
jgi:hypothetical protein